MAVGMLSSQAPQVLRVGESVASSPKALADKNARVYHHMVHGARFIMPDGLEIQFLGGVYATTDPAEIFELDRIANKSSSMIFTQAAAAESVKAQTSKLAEEAATQK